MKKRHSLADVSIIFHRGIFFDANILIYIFWPTGKVQWELQYSNFFSKLIKDQQTTGCVIAVDFFVISEVCNRIIRIEYEKYLCEKSLEKQTFPFKTFRDSDEGKTAIDEIFSLVKTKILKHFSVIGRAFSKTDIEHFLSIDTLDLCDKAILQICKENNYILLTNDKDFAQSDIEIISSNPCILSG